MRPAEVFSLPEGGRVSTSDYSVSVNPSSGASILTANHNGRKITKMVRTNPPSGDNTFEYNEDDEMMTGTTTNEMMVRGSSEPNNDYLLTNPSLFQEGAQALFGIPWKALRLVRGSERVGGPLGVFFNTLERAGLKSGDFRDSHFVSLVDANTWRQYIDNMQMTDVGAELNAAVSEEERQIIHHFLFNWDNDRDHIELMRRIVKGGTEADTLQKGSIVYNLMTNGFNIHQNLDTATTSFNRMYKLARDIIGSMRIRTYNYYELPLVHRDESFAIYTSLTSRYRPPMAEEASVIEEIRRMTQANGRNYAFRTTNNNHDPVGAYELMLQSVAAYDAGDILTMRMNIDVLMKPPHNFKPETGYIGLFDPTNDNYVGHQPIIAIFGKGGKGEEAVQHIMMYNPDLQAAIKKDNKIDMKRLKDGIYTEVVSLTNAKPLARWLKKDKNLIQIGEDEFEALTRTTESDNQTRRGQRGEQRILDERRSDRNNRGQARAGQGGRRAGQGARAPRPEDPPRQPRQPRERMPGPPDEQVRGPRANPGYGGEVKLGRGKFLYVQLFPKTKLTFAKKKNLTDEERKLGKTKGETLLGLTKLVPPKQSFGGVFVHTATHKDSGEEVPWLMRLPTSHFRAANTSVEGKNYRTIGLMKGSKALQDAWGKFGTVYGMPVFKSTKSLPTRFIIPNQFKGTMYEAHKKKVAKSRGKKV
jgi:hypothetical protein